MTYSQKPLLALLKKGRIAGESPKPEHIETVISNVFLFPERVYKLYKSDNNFFNKNFRDISTPGARFEFTKKDFSWNHNLSPDLHEKVLPVRVRNEALEITAEAGAEELLIVMRRFRSKDQLFERLIRGEVGEREAKIIGEQIAKLLKKAPSIPPDGHDYSLIFARHIEDTREWMAGVAEYLDTQEINMYCDALQEGLKRNKELFRNMSEEMAMAGDTHSCNAVYADSHLSLMDTFSPKDAWSHQHFSVPAYRLGTDLWALTGNRRVFESYLNGYREKSQKKVSTEAERIFILYAAGIMVSYLYMLSRSDPGKLEVARQYHGFLKNYYSDYFKIGKSLK